MLDKLPVKIINRIINKMLIKILDILLIKNIR